RARITSKTCRAATNELRVVQRKVCWREPAQRRLPVPRSAQPQAETASPARPAVEASTSGPGWNGSPAGWRLPNRPLMRGVAPEESAQRSAAERSSERGRGGAQRSPDPKALYSTSTSRAALTGGACTGGSPKADATLVRCYLGQRPWGASDGVL